MLAFNTFLSIICFDVSDITAVTATLGFQLSDCKLNFKSLQVYSQK